MFDKSTNNKSNKNEVRVKVPNIKMQMSVKNNSFFGKR